MTDLKLTRLRIEAGTYHGVLHTRSSEAVPQVGAFLRGDPVGVVSLTPIEGKMQDLKLELQLHAKILEDGVQRIILVESTTDTILDSFTLILGNSDAEDLRAEVALLRAELDLLKKAFRRSAQKME